MFIFRRLSKRQQTINFQPLNDRLSVRLNVGTETAQTGAKCCCLKAQKTRLLGPLVQKHVRGSCPRSKNCVVVVVDAVDLEPVSTAQFPANRENNSEFAHQAAISHGDEAAECALQALAASNFPTL